MVISKPWFLTIFPQMHQKAFIKQFYWRKSIHDCTLFTSLVCKRWIRISFYYCLTAASILAVRVPANWLRICILFITHSTNARFAWHHDDKWYKTPVVLFSSNVLVIVKSFSPYLFLFHTQLWLSCQILLCSFATLNWPLGKGKTMLQIIHVVVVFVSVLVRTTKE